MKWSTLISITGALSICLISAAKAAPPVYSHQDASGGVVFSDAPLVNGQMVRTSYQADYGRPVAKTSCNGLSAADMAARAKTFEQTILSAGLKHDVDVELIKAIAQVESCFDQNAVSRVGAQGVMQLMPGTAKELGVVDSFNAAQNIDGGAAYMAKMLKRFDQNHKLALAAYNAGPGAVEKHKGIPPYPETERYVEKVLKLYSPTKKQKS